ncbi:translation initiation factor III [Actinoplanes sp. KI2]|uniref:translation initiation factor III n=1 Tax=Actinoplanes sp. KI2 TaxID=2983315 RepID=UPI0021D5B2A3|nr:translation initiation factor III [Actinoplanes sp. KI2]MCU7729283.1 translation initiation factor III [Actinoplanes sp. KI2]
MARTGNNQRSANRVAVDVGATGTKSASTGAILVLGACVLAALWALAMMTPIGRVIYVYVFMYLEFYMGVLVLVSISITIMVGLVSTDRLVLSIRQRVFLQSIHRTTGVMAVVALAFHLWTKTAEGHIRAIDIVIPFIAQSNRLYISFGQISAYILILVIWTGIARARFIGRGKPWMWRAIHSIPYLMWPIALMHGLGAGRAAKTWVIVSYVVCVLMVLIGLAVRLSVSLNRRKDFSSSSGVGIKPAGNMVPTSSPAMKKPRRRDPEPEPQTLGPVAVVDTFQPAAPPLASERAELVAPAAPRQRRAVEDEIEYDEPAPRGRRYPGEDTSTRMRRPDYEDTSTRMRRSDLEDTSTRMRRAEMDDTGSRMRRVEMDDTGSRMRRVEMDDTSSRMRRIEADDFGEPAPRSRRRSQPPEPMPMYDDAPRGRRRAEPDYDDIPRQRGGGRYEDDRRSARYEPRFGEEAEEAPRARRDRGADLDRADSGRHSRSGFVDLVDEDDETPTLVDMASRRARRDQQEPGRGQAGRGARRGGRDRVDDDVADDQYWSQLRGEAN